MQVVSRYNVQLPGWASVFELVEFGLVSEVDAALEIVVALDELAPVGCVATATVALLTPGPEPVAWPVRWRYYRLELRRLVLGVLTGVRGLLFSSSPCPAAEGESNMFFMLATLARS